MNYPQNRKIVQVTGTASVAKKGEYRNPVVLK